MPNSLLGAASSPANSILRQINNLSAMANGNPQALFSSIMQSNPRFAQFVAQNQGKTPEQAFRDAGIDYDQVRQYL